MRLDARAFGIAAGATAAVLFILCALAVAIAPGPTTAFAGYLIHTDLSGLSRSLTLANFVGGLVCWALGTALTFWLVAAIYNRLIRAGSTASVTEPRPVAHRA
jgi:membrane protein YqaA with SNARE-associated domain